MGIKSYFFDSVGATLDTSIPIHPYHDHRLDPHRGDRPGSHHIKRRPGVNLNTNVTELLNGSGIPPFYSVKIIGRHRIEFLTRSLGLSLDILFLHLMIFRVNFTLRNVCTNYSNYVWCSDTSTLTFIKSGKEDFK